MSQRPEGRAPGPLAVAAGNHSHHPCPRSALKIRPYETLWPFARRFTCTGSGWKSTWPIPGPRPRFRGKCQKRVAAINRQPGAQHIISRIRQPPKGRRRIAKRAPDGGKYLREGPCEILKCRHLASRIFRVFPAYRNLQNARQPLQASNLTNCGFSRQWPECRPFQNRDAPYRCRT